MDRTNCCKRLLAMMNFVHEVLVLLHTIIAALSFIAGSLVVVLRRTSWLFQLYLWAMVAAAATLLLLVIWDWQVFILATQIVYVVISLLAFYSIYRGFLAQQKQSHRYTGWRLEFMDDVGFTLIYLFDAFVIIGAIDLTMPAWAIA
ncbi:MAG: hypothetical protein EOP45_23070, partial [Sphingobacteriaceae bacterium]